MTKIIVATIVKNEDDIVRDWIIYYGEMFGYTNLYIIDNCSTDNTFRICQEFVCRGIHLEQLPDYKLKGEYMTRYKNSVQCDFFLPVDIDEFIVFYDPSADRLSPSASYISGVVPYFTQLAQTHPSSTLFKMNYISPLKTDTGQFDQKDYFHCFSHGITDDYGMYAKSFLQNTPEFLSMKIDHGNHIPSSNYTSTQLYLVHYHFRSAEQHKKKVRANLEGFGYSLALDDLKALGGNCAGNHHVKRYIHMLENPNELVTGRIINHIPVGSVHLKFFSDFFKCV